VVLFDTGTRGRSTVLISQVYMTSLWKNILTSRLL